MNSPRRFVLLACLLTALFAPVAGVSAAPQDEKGDWADEPVLAEAKPGRKALDALSSSAEETVAERNGRSVENLRSLLAHDDTAWVSATGRLFYVDHADASDVAYVEDEVPPQRAAAWATLPESQTFQLHSKPGSQHTAYLDFDGYTLPAGTAWSTGGKTIPPGTYGGFDLGDGSGAAFSSAEKTYIQTVWRIVSEKYAPFDVDVTTQLPPAGALNRSPVDDPTYGTSVVITNDMAARGTVCTADASGGCVGIAYVDVFDQPADTWEPAWVYTRFTNATPVFTAGSVANTAAHELGHTLGLDHDCQAPNITASCYYAGHDNWFPIMGSSNRAVGHFTNASSYSLAYTAQSNPDDLAVIAASGAPLRADDVSGTKALGQAASYSQDGIIERAADTDVFSVSRACTNTLTATASGIGLGQAVDLKVTVRNPSNVVAATADPTTTGNTSTTPNTPVNMDATASVPSAGAGTWTVTVEGTNVAGSAGYTDYGSIGRYHLDISGCGAVPPPPPPPPPPGTGTGTNVHRFWSPAYNNAHFYTIDSSEADQLRATNANWVYEGVAFKARSGSSAGCSVGIPVFRFWSAGYRTHFYTADKSESDQVRATNANWAFEGIAYCADSGPQNGGTPLYRFWSPVYRNHFYTADKSESDQLRTTNRNWTYEGIAYYVLPTG